jgi:hypothetical protein
MNAMTAVELHRARTLIPGAYEPNAPLQRATRAASLVPAPQFPEARPHPATAGTPYVVAAPAHPTTRLGFAAAILGDLALGTAVIFAVALAPVLAVQGIGAAVALIVEMFGRQ